MNKRRLQFTFFVLLGFALIFTGPQSWAAGKKDEGQITRDEFFIVSEVNLKKSQVVMEEPTQITMTMNVNDKTVFTNEQGHRLPIKDMRAGDTVYVTYERDSKGVLTALTIRMGPMTVQELRRRYFHG